MAAAHIHYDGIDRRRLIRAIFAEARRQKKNVPPQSRIGAMLGISQAAVSYHIRKMKEARK